MCHGFYIAHHGKLLSLQIVRLRVHMSELCPVEMGSLIKEILNHEILKDILVFSLPYKFNKFLET